MATRYIPILRWKQGERRGVAQLPTPLKQSITPLFQVGTDQYRPPKAKKYAGLSAAQSLVNEIHADWGTSPFYLDASEVAAAPGSAHHPIVDIAAAARAAGLQLIPATSLGSPAAYTSGAQVVAGVDSRGVALRVDLQELATAASWTPSWGAAPGDTDLIADFRGTVGTVLSMAAAATSVFLSLAPVWRTVAVAGTSMPLDFSGYSAGTYAIPRSEWLLWQSLSTAGLPYEIGYGDYATVSLAMPPSAIAWGYPINAKYTLQNDFLICRGVKTRGRGGVDMAPQLIGHAKTIHGFATRAPLAGCWADQMIDDIASGTQGPGGLETWVRIGVNRHIHRVRTDLP